MRAALWLALLISPALASTELYKWVDEQGRTQYSDIPPNTPAQSFKTDRVDTGSSISDLAGREQDFNIRRAATQQEYARQQNEQARAELAASNCRKARANLTTLETAHRIADPDRPGAPMDEATRARLRDAALRDVETWCVGR